MLRVTQQLLLASKVTSNKKPSKSDNSTKNITTEFCIACQDGATNANVTKHSTFDCDHWLNLSLPERRKLVKCEYHPRTTNHITRDCKFKKPRAPCRYCNSGAHHALFCPIHKSTINLTSTGSVYVTDMPNTTSNLQAPVLLPFVFVKARKPHSSTVSSRPKFARIGSLTDNCATDSWITFTAAKKLNLEGQDITISAGGFGGKRELIKSKLFSVEISSKNGLEVIECLGVEKIGNDEVPPDAEKYSELCRKFQVDGKEVRRPIQIEMLIGQRGNHLHPDIIIKSLDGMRLLTGPLGKTFAGADQSRTLGDCQLSSNFFTSAIVQEPILSVAAHQIKDSPSSADYSIHAAELEANILSHSLLCKTSRDFLNFFKEESIGVDSHPRCGNCACGNCAIGSKLKSIKEEKDYEVIRGILEYDSTGSEQNPGPYWRSVLPWEVDKQNLGNNHSMVHGTLNATLRKLGKNPMWRKTYEDELRALIVNGMPGKYIKQS